MDLMLPANNKFNVEVMAHHLARICRYGGATTEHYSVAQHLVLCSFEGPPEFARELLWHDGHEFAFGDTIGPVLALLRFHSQGRPTVLDFYREQMDRAICSQLGLSFYAMHGPAVRHADRVLYAAERRDLLGPCEQEWPGRKSLPDASHIGKIEPWDYEIAREAFLSRWRKLGGVR